MLVLFRNVFDEMRQDEVNIRLFYLLCLSCFAIVITDIPKNSETLSWVLPKTLITGFEVCVIGVLSHYLEHILYYIGNNDNFIGQSPSEAKELLDPVIDFKNYRLEWLPSHILYSTIIILCAWPILIKITPLLAFVFITIVSFFCCLYSVIFRLPLVFHYLMSIARVGTVFVVVGGLVLASLHIFELYYVPINIFRMLSERTGDAFIISGTIFQIKHLMRQENARKQSTT